MKNHFASYLFIVGLLLTGTLGMMPGTALGDTSGSTNNAEFGLSEDFIEHLANYSESFKIQTTQTHKERFFELSTADFEEENEEEVHGQDSHQVFAQAFTPAIPNYSLHYDISGANYRQQCFNFNALRDIFLVNRVFII